VFEVWVWEGGGSAESSIYWFGMCMFVSGDVLKTKMRRAGENMNL
jgi:hypothetical protein